MVRSGDVGRWADLLCEEVGVHEAGPVDADVDVGMPHHLHRPPPHSQARATAAAR